MLSRVLTSYMLSRMRPEKVKQLLTMLSALTASVFFATVYSPSFIILHAVLLVFVGATVSVAYIFTLYLISEKTAEQNSVFLIGMFETLIGSFFLLGPLLAGYLTDAYGFASVLMIFGLSSALGGVLSLLHRV
ncbi:MAG: MFS transporter, partial [Candidatus Caldarchaeum sp.]|nr:MFS transporter [Candidatus Caldarchaeum sp.]MDW8436399.1 MFS transporter [Candidatus Caldarchaeum sp.]